MTTAAHLVERQLRESNDTKAPRLGGGNEDGNLNDTRPGITAGFSDLAEQHGLIGAGKRGIAVNICE